MADLKALAAFGLIVMLAGCTSTAPTSSPTAMASASRYARLGFVTEVRDGRLWVFREDSAELQEFRTLGELGKSVTRVGAGPNGMTIRAADAQTLDDYMASK